MLNLHLEERDAGIRILGGLRADRETAGIPVILATAQPRPTREQHPQPRVLGCGWLTKPYTLGTLLSAVQGGLVGDLGALPAG